MTCRTTLMLELEADCQTLILSVSCAVTVADSCQPFVRSRHKRHVYEIDGEY